MLINAENLLQYQRCKRRTFLDINADKSQRDTPNDLLAKLQQDKQAYHRGILAPLKYEQPKFPLGNREAAQAATLELMQRGVEYIYQGVLLSNYSEQCTLLSRPDLM